MRAQNDRTLDELAALYRARTTEAHEAALRTVLDALTAADAQGRLAHGGYAASK